MAKLFEELLLTSAERALRTYARWTSGDENTIAKTALPGLEALKVLVAAELDADLEASETRLRVGVPVLDLVPGGRQGLDANAPVDVVVYEAASGAPIRLIQLLNAPTHKLFQTSLKLSLLRGAYRPNLPDAFELLVTDGHASEQAANDALRDVDLTTMQGFELSRVIALRDSSAQAEMFIGVAVVRILHDD